MSNNNEIPADAELVATHVGAKSYLDKLISDRYWHPGLDTCFIFRWKQFSDGKYAVNVYRTKHYETL